MMGITIRKKFISNGDRDITYIKSIIKNDNFFIYSVISFFIASFVFVADYYDFPSILISKILNPVFIVLVLNLVLVLLLLIVNLHVIELFRIHVINLVDYVFIVSILSSVGYLIYIMLFRIVAAYKIKVALFVIIMMGCLVGLRIRFYKREDRECITNLYDLNQIYENKIKHVQGEPILIRETDVDYDLFKRDDIINQLYRTIAYTESDKSYVISLEGIWGSGKTTIINNVKRKIKEEGQENNYIIIDDFDPWIYGTPEALLHEMYDSLLTHLGVSYSSVTEKRILDGICNVVAKEYTVGGFLQDFFLNYDNETKSVSQLKTRVGNLIKAEGKKVVFIIDNLDRANDENIVFCLK